MKQSNFIKCGDNEIDEDQLSGVYVVESLYTAYNCTGTYLTNHYYKSGACINRELFHCSLDQDYITIFEYPTGVNDCSGKPESKHNFAHGCRLSSAGSSTVAILIQAVSNTVKFHAFSIAKQTAVLNLLYIPLLVALRLEESGTCFESLIGEAGEILLPTRECGGVAVLDFKSTNHPDWSLFGSPISVPAYIQGQRAYAT
ncbi:hypothetical protein PPL_08552 [Heterostelium album PN500]|uniref:Uncharacterized protein n=1 Tax=Heterostelium pallidum (strain ATCC 26659 / Pp 5 / PN500) TaxID=670386 RepID=D3BJ32_HETP5|nr:hypothetical protein PPL_08552 [Heterostelium album PN500]EFA77912.1 hypothetical protein PPL_08552 [Heterostelium album PN500]|eukprot:XP_020430040.1 hypothetical protein PPL_08552 [Heterostelium album PN500]